MKTLLIIALAGLLCIVGLFLSRRLESLSIDVVSCVVDPDHHQAIVTMKYTNRTAEGMWITYDLRLIRGTGRRQYAFSMHTVNTRHGIAAELGPHETREDTVKLDLPANITAVRAIAENPAFREEPAPAQPNPLPARP